MTRDTIYREILLEHARHPKNSGRLENPGLSASVKNPLCGDELELTLALSGELIQDCMAMVRGCSICQASASIMSEIIIRKTLKEAIKIGRLFDEMVQVELLASTENPIEGRHVFSNTGIFFLFASKQIMF